MQLVGVAKTSTIPGALVYTATYLFLDLALVATDSRRRASSHQVAAPSVSIPAPHTSQ